MELEFQLKKPVAFVFDYLSDMQKFVAVHPLIYKIEPKGENRYTILERLSILGMPVAFTYPAEIESQAAEKSVTMRAEVMKLVKITLQFKLRGDETTTQVHETIQFNTALPVRFILKRVFKKQHLKLFKNIDAL